MVYINISMLLTETMVRKYSVVNTENPTKRNFYLEREELHETTTRSKIHIAR